MFPEPHSSGYIFVADSVGWALIALTQFTPKAAKFGKNNAK